MMNKLLRLCVFVWMYAVAVLHAEVATPQFNPAGGVSNTYTDVRISCETPGAVIRYSTSGLDPAEQDQSIASGATVRVGGNLTLKARAWNEGEVSAVQSQTYYVAGGIAAGSIHALALSADRVRVWGWGNNGYGQVGDGTLGEHHAPVRVKSNPEEYLTDVVSIAAAYRTSIAVKSDGTVWAWGKNEYYLLGNSSLASSTVPLQIKTQSGAALDHIVEVVSLNVHALALKDDGTVWGWGKNSQGHLGDGTVVGQRAYAAPVKFSSGEVFDRVVAVAVGQEHSLALRDDGTLWAWGYNDNGQLGDGTTTRSVWPKQIMSGVAHIGAGYNSTFAVKPDGTLWAWGRNASGQLGLGTTITPQQTPAQVLHQDGTPLTNVVAIDGGQAFTLALKGDGTVWGWGENNNGELAIGSTQTPQLWPVQVRTSAAGQDFLSGVVAIACGDDYSMALLDNGKLRTWGYDGSGQLANGIGVTSQQLLANNYASIPSLTNTPPAVTMSVSSESPYTSPATLSITAMANDSDAGDSIAKVDFLVDSTVFFTDTSSPYEWSWSNVPAGVYRISARATDIAGDTTQTPGVDITVDEPVLPVGQVATPEFNPAGGVSDIVFDVSITCATPGAIIRYTTNGNDPVETDAQVPPDGRVHVGRVLTMKARAWANGEVSAVRSQRYFVSGGIAAGSLHGLAVGFDGKKVWGWGSNNSGQVGDGTTTERAAPTRVMADSQNFFTDVRSLAACYRTSIAVKTDGTVWAWGKNESSLLGNPSQTYSSYPQQIMAQGGTPLTGVTEPVALWNHALALADGKIWGWGKNTQGHLGNGQVENARSQASLVKFADGTVFDQVVAVAVGGEHSLALRADGTMWAWGYNSDGQLGDGTITRQLYPKKILSHVAYIGAGYNCSFAVLTNGTVWAWGRNAAGELGLGQLSGPQLTPAQIFVAPGVPLTGVVTIECGEEHALALKDDGTVWGWGKNNNGQLGQGSTATPQLWPVQVRVPDLVPGHPSYLTDVVAVACGDNFSVALKEDGSVITFGSDAYSALGNGPSTSSVLFAAPNSYMPKLANSPPAATLSISPTGPYMEPLNLTLTATATDPDGGAISKVEFLNGETVLFSATTSPYIFEWANVPAGEYNLSARVTDNVGGVGQSAPQSITVTGASVEVSIAPLVGQTSESSGTPGSARITRTGGTGSALTVVYAVSGTATSGSDFVALSGTATIPQGGSFVDVAISPIRDYLVEGAESVVISIQPNLSYNLGAVSTATVEILDELFVAKPVLSIPGGRYLSAQSITVSCETPDAELHYTLDGRVPSTSDPMVVSGQPITVADSAILRVAGFRAAYTSSDVANALYRIGPVDAIGDYRGIYASTDGDVFSWGATLDAQGNAERNDPALLSLTGAVEVAVSKNESWIVKSDGTVWTTPPGTPVAEDPELAGSRAIAFDRLGRFLVLLRPDGTVWTRGANVYGMGDGTLSALTLSQIVALDRIVAISCGEGYALALRDDGTVWGWGWRQGLGVGTTSDTQLVPIQVPGIADAVAIAAGGIAADGTATALALRADGTVVSWSSTPPASVAGLSDVIGISAGAGSWYAVIRQGALWTWGANDFGQLGDGTNTPRATPAALVDVADAAGVVAGGNAAMVLRSENRPWSCGRNLGGALGIGSTLPSSVLVQVRIPFDSDDDGLPDDWEILYGLNPNSPPGSSDADANPDGDLYTNLEEWQNGFNPLQADGDKAPKLTIISGDDQSAEAGEYLPEPLVVKVEHPDRGTPLPGIAITFVITEGDGELVLTEGGIPSETSLEATSDEYGLASVWFKKGPVAPNAKITVTAVIGEGQASVSLTAYLEAPVIISPAGGRFATEQLVAVSCADTRTTIRYTLDGNEPTSGSPVVPVSGTVLVRASGVLKARAFISGAPATDTETAEFAITGQLAAGIGHQVVLHADGTVWTWGLNGDGQLGDGTHNNNSAPVRPRTADGAPLRDVTAIAAGLYHTVALKRDGTVFAWGSNGEHELGSGDTVSANRPQQVLIAAGTPLSQVVAIAAGFYHSVALTSDGKVWAWGSNEDGGLGNGTSSSPLYASKVQRLVDGVMVDLSDIAEVFSGPYQSFARTNQGTIVGWGTNGDGELGLGYAGAMQFTAIEVSQLNGSTLVAGGYGFSFAVTSSGSAKSVGYNSLGNLGIGTTGVDVLTPTAMAGTMPALFGIDGGTDHGIALAQTGAVYTWGYNNRRQVANDAVNVHATPQTVVLGSSGTKATSVIAGYEQSLAISDDGGVWIWGRYSDGSPNMTRDFSAPTRIGYFNALHFQDSDQDGLSDAEEVELGTNPHKADSDGDGIDDATEINNGTDPRVNGSYNDLDGDGLTDAEEAILGTDPTVNNLPSGGSGTIRLFTPLEVY